VSSIPRRQQFVSRHPKAERALPPPASNQMGRRDHLGETMEDYELRDVLGQLPLLKGRRQIGQGMGPLLRPRKTIHALRIATDRAHSLGLGVQHGIEAAL